MYCLQTLLGLCRDLGCRGGAGFKRKLVLAARHVAVGLIRGLGRDGDDVHPRDLYRGKGKLRALGGIAQRPRRADGGELLRQVNFAKNSEKNSV